MSEEPSKDYLRVCGQLSRAVEEIRAAAFGIEGEPRALMIAAERLLDDSLRMIAEAYTEKSRGEG